MRESAVDSNRSTPSSCCPSLSSVSETERDFLDKHNVIDMITPDISRNEL